MKANPYIPALALLAVLASLLAPAQPSSHSEAPGISRIPSADATDFYAFRSYEPGREDFATFVLNAQPLQSPYGGPNYFSLSDDHFYEIYIDNDGDCTEDITFQFYYGNSLGGANVTRVPDFDPLTPCSAPPETMPETMHGGLTVNVSGVEVAVPLKFVGPVTSPKDADLNWFEWYRINRVDGDRSNPTSRQAVTHAGSGGATFAKPFDYAGTKTFPDYASYVEDNFYHDIDIPGCAVPGARVFVGQRHEPFYINLGKIFDLFNLVPIAAEGFKGGIKQSPTNNDLRYNNIISFVLEVPIACLSPANGVIGAWTGVRQLIHDEAGDHQPGLQISRLGNPLVNELVIGIIDKGRFNTGHPTNDSRFAHYVTHPSVPFLVDALFRSAVGASGNIAPETPRLDLVIAFLEGVEGLNRFPAFEQCEMLRLNTSIPPRAREEQDPLGVIAGDAAGFPNGRRPGDDVVDIALRVMMGKLCKLSVGCTPEMAPVGDAEFTDGAPIRATDFLDAFPFINLPLPGSAGYGGDRQGDDDGSPAARLTPPFKLF